MRYTSVQVSPPSEESSSFQFQPFSSGGKNVVLRSGSGIGDLNDLHKDSPGLCCDNETTSGRYWLH